MWSPNIRQYKIKTCSLCVCVRVKRERSFKWLLEGTHLIYKINTFTKSCHTPQDPPFLSRAKRRFWNRILLLMLLFLFFFHLFLYAFAHISTWSSYIQYKCIQLICDYNNLCKFMLYLYKHFMCYLWKTLCVMSTQKTVNCCGCVIYTHSLFLSHTFLFLYRMICTHSITRWVHFKFTLFRSYLCDTFIMHSVSCLYHIYGEL